MLGEWWKCRCAIAKFRGYEPQRVTRDSFKRWLYQFDDPVDRKLVLELLDSIVYLDEQQVKRALLDLNRALLQRLEGFGIPPEKIIYVQTDDAGSSSTVVLNFLRNRDGLEKRGCKLIDSNNVRGLNTLTNELGEGAIIYVDDFVGTGDQLAKVRGFIGEYIFGSFSEFVLAPSICEEGVHQLGRIGIEPVTKYLHAKSDRPLHELSSRLDDLSKRRLIELSRIMDTSCYYRGLGYKYAAGMVVLYSNAPDELPRIFRGSSGQKPKVGLFPRHQDLPI
ncbi:MAG: hypothetical protein HOP33_00785 [Verrucomicrobia bacterium]|nr:hypothetical protein [Verrucomicrobiota bacterium]